MKIHLTEAFAADIPTLLMLEKELTGTNVYSAMITEDEWMAALQVGRVYLIEADAKTVGDISYEIKGKDHVHIAGIAIIPQFQGKGIGRQAMEQILEELEDFKKIDLVVHPKNEAALKLYKSMGFTAKETKENFYGDGEPRLIMALKK